MIKLITILLSFYCQLTYAQVNVKTVKRWQGEPYGSGKGGLFFKFLASSDLKLAKPDKMDIRLIHNSNLTIYSINISLRRNIQGALDAFLLPAGVYRISSIFLKAGNNTLQYTGPSPSVIKVLPGTLTQTGRWKLSKGKKKKLLVKLLKPVNKKTSTSSKKKAKNSSTKKPKPKSKPKSKLIKLSKASPKPLGNDGSAFEGPRTRGPALSSNVAHNRALDDIRVGFRDKKRLAMLYRIDLKRNNRFASKFQKAIAKNDAQLRSCYSEGLARNEDLSGSVQFNFMYSRKNKTFQVLKVARKSLSDEKMVECVYWKLAGITFPVDYDIPGQLTFIFSTK